MNKTFLALTFAATMAVSLRAAPMGTAFTYQGKLQDGGVPANGYYDFDFKLFDGANTINQQGATLHQTLVTVSNGLFTVKLDFGNQFPGDARWLEIWANTNTQPVVQLSPRQELTPQPYAIFAGTAATVTNQAITTVQLAPGAVTAPQIGALAPPTPGQVLTYSPAGLFWTTPSSLAWLLNGNGGTTSSNFLGTTDNKALEVRVNNSRALRIEPDVDSPNLIGGPTANSVAAGWYGASIGGGGAAGSGHWINGAYATIGGGIGNTNTANYTTIGGGFWNRAAGQDAVVAGGSQNIALSGQSTVGGGIANQANGSVSTVAGGSKNVASGQDSVVSGGSSNLAASVQSTIGGGSRNTAIGTATTIGGGYYNSNFTAYGTIGGGDQNIIMLFSTNSTIGGGHANSIATSFSFVGGGQFNSITTNAEASVVGGGRNNRIESVDYPGLGIAYAYGSAIAGGEGNVISGATDAAIVGGLGNTNSGFASAVLGGEKNVVVFDHSVVSGNGGLSRASFSVTHGGMFSIPGDGQISQYLLKGTTFGTTTLDLAGPIPPVGSGIGFTAIISAKAFGDFSGAFEVKGVIRNYGGGVAFVAAPSITVLGRDNASLSVAAVVATGGRLGFRVTGISGLSVRWVCSLQTAEVQF